MDNYPISEEDYTFIFEKVPRLCVDLIIQNEDGILFSLRNIDPAKDKWHIPGGMVRKEETVLEAAKRIAKAETGLDIEIVKTLGYIEFLREINRGRNFHTISIAFKAKILGGELKNDYQSTELRFFKTLPEEMVLEQKIFLQTII